MDREARADEFLPPEPSGPEPELGGSEQPAETQPDTASQEPIPEPPAGQPPQPGWQPPPPGWQAAPGWQQPAPGWQQQASGQQPAGAQQSVPGWQQQAPPGQAAGARSPQGWQQPPAQGWMPPPPGWQPPPPGWQPAAGWAYYAQPREPDNGAAVAGFVTSLVAAALLVMSFGFLGILSLIASPFGIHYSRKGKANVDEGRTPKHRGLAQAGFVIGIITLVISAIVTVLGIIFVIALATDEQFRRDFEHNDPNLDSTRVQAVLLTVRLAIRLLG